MIHRRTPQTKTEQRQIMHAAMRDGTLDSLRWYIMGKVPGLPDAPVAVNNVVLVLSAAPDPAEQEHYAHLLLELCRMMTPHIIMRLELTATDILAQSGVQWFDYAELDHVCPTCAGINNDCICTPTLWRIPDEIEVWHGT